MELSTAATAAATTRPKLNQKRQSSTNLMNVSSSRHITSACGQDDDTPWCLPVLPPLLTSTGEKEILYQTNKIVDGFLQQIATNNKDTKSTDQTSMVALVGPVDDDNKTALASISCPCPLHHHHHQQQQQQPTSSLLSSYQKVLWLHASSEIALRASYCDALIAYAPEITKTIITTTTTTTTSCKPSTQQQQQQQQQEKQESVSTLQLAKMVLQHVLILDDNDQENHWQIIYDNVTVEPSVFFSQWAIPSTAISTVLTTCRNDYLHWKQHRYSAIAIEKEEQAAATSAATTVFWNAVMVTKNDQDKNEYDDNTEEGTVAELVNLLQRSPLALTLLAQANYQHGHHFVNNNNNNNNTTNRSWEEWLQELQHFKTDYNNSSNKNYNNSSSLEWFWNWIIKRLWQYHSNLVDLLSVLYHEMIPAELLNHDDFTQVLPDLQSAHILQPQSAYMSSNDDDDAIATKYYSVPFELHQHMHATSTVVDAIPIALRVLQPYYDLLSSSSSECQPRYALPLAWLPHLQTLLMHMEEAEQGIINGYSVSYAQLLLQTGILCQKQAHDTSRAVKYYQKGIALLTNTAAQDSSRNGATVTRRLLYYRLAAWTRSKGNYSQAKEYSLLALEGYGFVWKDVMTAPERQTLGAAYEFVQQDLTSGNQSNKDWNIVSQLFHTCGHASRQKTAEDPPNNSEARIFFEYELAVKRAWYKNGKPHERVARTLNNLGSVCRDAGDLIAARDYSQECLDMQMALSGGGTLQDSLETATTLNNLGSLSYSLCSFQEAQGFFERALAMKHACYRQENVDANSPILNLDVGETLYNLGMLQDHFSNYDKAQGYYLKSLECKMAVYGNAAKNADLATTLSSLGLSAMNHGHYKQSEIYYNNALDMQNEFYKGNGNMETVRTLHGLGILNYHLQRIEPSRRFHRQALEMQHEIEARERSHRPVKAAHLTDPRTANLSQVLQSLGNLSHNLGSYDEARDFYEQGLKLYSQVSTDQTMDILQDLSSASNYDAARIFYERALKMKYDVYGKGANNTDLAFTLRSLALLNNNSGRSAEAEDCYVKALDMFQHFYGSKDAENTEIAAILDGLGTVKFKQGQYSESREFLVRALAMKEFVYGGPQATNDDVASSHVILGTLAHTVGDYETARHHLETAFEMQQEIYGHVGEEDQNIERGVTANCLANLYRDLGEIEKAEALYMRSVAYMGKDAENPYLAAVLTDFGEHYRLIGDYEKADKCLNRAARLQRKIYGDGAENSEIAFTMASLGKLKLDEGRLDEAEHDLERALEMQRAAADKDGEIAETLYSLGNLSRHKGDLLSAKSRLEEARVMRKSIHGNSKTVEMARNLACLEIVYEELKDDKNAQSCKEELSALINQAPVLQKARRGDSGTARCFAEFLKPKTSEHANVKKSALKTELWDFDDDQEDWIEVGHSDSDESNDGAHLVDKDHSAPKEETTSYDIRKEILPDRICLEKNENKVQIVPLHDTDEQLENESSTEAGYDLKEPSLSSEENGQLHGESPTTNIAATTASNPSKNKKAFEGDQDDVNHERSMLEQTSLSIDKATDLLSNVDKSAAVFAFNLDERDQVASNLMKADGQCPEQKVRSMAAGKPQPEEIRNKDLLLRVDDEEVMGMPGPAALLNAVGVEAQPEEKVIGALDNGCMGHSADAPGVKNAATDFGEDVVEQSALVVGDIRNKEMPSMVDDEEDLDMQRPGELINVGGIREQPKDTGVNATEVAKVVHSTEAPEVKASADFGEDIIEESIEAAGNIKEDSVEYSIGKKIPNMESGEDVNIERSVDSTEAHMPDNLSDQESTHIQDTDAAGPYVDQRTDVQRDTTRRPTSPSAQAVNPGKQECSNGSLRIQSNGKTTNTADTRQRPSCHREEEGAPEMDWTNKELVKRLSQRYLKESSSNEKRANKRQLSTPSNSENESSSFKVIGSAAAITRSEQTTGETSKEIQKPKNGFEASADTQILVPSKDTRISSKKNSEKNQGADDSKKSKIPKLKTKELGKQPEGGSLQVTDMPSRSKSESVELAGCGCWPFMRLFKA